MLQGIMYFETDISENEWYPDSWAEMQKVNNELAAVRELLRVVRGGVRVQCWLRGLNWARFQGHPNDMVQSSAGTDFDAPAIVQSIRSDRALLLFVLNVATDGG
jgi:hypothetical protein